MSASQTFDYTTSLAGAHFPTPIFTASGCASSGKELAQFFDLTSGRNCHKVCNE